MAQKAKPRLGRGLSSLIGQPVEVPTTQPNNTQTSTVPVAAPEGEPSALQTLPVARIVPSPFQPRENTADANLESLAASIKSSGVMQPIAVRPIAQTDPRHATGLRFELIAGERRWRAAQLAGLDHIPAIISDLDDQQSAEWALVENVQRADLSPVERAAALHRLAQDFNLSHNALAQRLGLDRSTISNLIRINELEPEIKELLASGGLSMGHAKALLALPQGDKRVRIARSAAESAWSVRRLEALAAADPAKAKKTAAGQPAPDPLLSDIEKQLSDHLSTRVRLRTNAARSKGSITIDFYDLEHFDGLMKSLGVNLQI